jgi:osmotically-inducible protein OsmY
MTDLTLSEAIMQALAENPRVHPDEIAVEAGARGEIILRGTVGSPLQRAEAVRTARGVPGVHDVEDRLEIRLMGLEGRADADTEAAVLDALIADDELHVSDIDVDVRDGAATLRGVVELVAQRDRAERVVMAVPGVTRVDNRLHVWLTVSADEVAERVTNALGAGAVVGAEQISVDVVDNDVTLTGAVGSIAHHDAALAAAARAPGVAHVHDCLTVLPDPR